MPFVLFNFNQEILTEKVLVSASISESESQVSYITVLQAPIKATGRYIEDCPEGRQFH